MAQMNVAGQVHGARDSLSMGAPLYSNNGPVELIPNPDFVFPMVPSSPTEPITISGRRPRSLQPTSTTRRGSAHTRGKSTNTLPGFSFNPAGDTAESSSAPSPASPLASLPTTPTTPSHPMGHRRGGSEFIGGDGKSGLGLLSTSPTKGDGFLPPPSNVLMPGPPAGRRGHAHRRSGAISSHDLSSIMQPSHPRMPITGGSAPATPMENDMTGWPRPPINKASSQPSLHSFAMDENTPPANEAESSPRRPPSRARVGFSDTVEYIRPLSTISSETEGSLSTIRGHSGSNSLSSVISAGAPSPPSGRRGRPTLDSTPERDNITARPKTAGAIWDLRQEQNLVFGEELKTRKRPMSALIPSAPLSPVSTGSPSPGTPKKRHFFHIPLRHTDSEIPSSSEPNLQSVQMETPPASPMKESTDETSEEEMGKVRSSSRKSNKPRKVKSWANSIISRKPKSTSRPKQSSSQATVANPTLLNNEPDMIPDFDVDNTVTIVTPTNDQISQPKMDTDFASWKPKHVTPEQDARSPIIDLDLALSPFESEKRNGPGARAQRRAMHSAGFMTGLQNHRRTESAPALVPFEARTTMGPTSVMADVFEEEEEEEERATISSGKDSTRSVKVEEPEVKAKEVTSMPAEDEEAGVGIKLVDSDMIEGSTIKWNFDDGLRIHRSREELPTVLEVPQSPHSKPAQLADPVNTAVEVVEDFEEPRTSSLTRSSDSTITPSLHSETKESQPTMTLPVPLSDQSLRTPDTFTSSSFSSPNFNRSQSSFDTPRLGTAASSVTDNRTLNSQFGEPGPEVRMSTEVPSLTSSRSTMTNGPHHHPLISPRILGDRASSVSSLHSGASERRNKRSSIASLSRLMGVGGSFGERSKLNIEQRPQSEHMDLKVKEAKTKKTRRLSKMMQFWRSKESLRS